MSCSSDPGDWYGFLIWTCLSFKILNLFRILSSWGSGNYRPSAPLLYEVASHVKNCHSGHYYYYYYYNLCYYYNIVWSLYMRRTDVESAFIPNERPTIYVRQYTHAFVECFVNSAVVINRNARIFARYVSYVIMYFPPAPTVLTLRETCLSCLVNTTSPQLNMASKPSSWKGSSSTRTTTTRRLTTTSHLLNSKMTSCSQTTSALSVFPWPTPQTRRNVSRPDGEPPVNTFSFFVTT